MSSAATLHEDLLFSFMQLPGDAMQTLFHFQGWTQHEFCICNMPGKVEMHGQFPENICTKFTKVLRCVNMMSHPFSKWNKIKMHPQFASINCNKQISEILLMIAYSISARVYNFYLDEPLVLLLPPPPPIMIMHHHHYQHHYTTTTISYYEHHHHY